MFYTWSEQARRSKSNASSSLAIFHHDMKLSTFVATAVALFGVYSVGVLAALPDRIDVHVKNLAPEHTVYDRTRQLFYQSNLWKGLIEVWDNKRQSHFNVRIDGVSSGGDGEQQMSGLSLQTHDNPKRLFAVAKNSHSFDFSENQKDDGPSSFHCFSLPLKEDSKPEWSVYLQGVQDEFVRQTGTRPFGVVQSAQDRDGNSYIAFALGMPAVAKISPDGKNVEAWAYEKGNGGQRPGYSGITYDAHTNRLLAFGGPRPLTVFNLDESNPKPKEVRINGKFGKLDGTEKITTIPVGNENVLVGARAPWAISFKTDDNWKSASIKKTKREELRNSGFTAVTDYYKGKEQGIYGVSAFFENGAHGGRDSWPLYRLDSDILHF